MFPVMILLMMGRDMRAMEPTEPLFWAVMSLGVLIGFATAYPVNVWMVSKNLKHGLMTARPAPVDRPPEHPVGDGTDHSTDHGAATTPSLHQPAKVLS
jgi:hypothetical protein